MYSLILSLLGGIGAWAGMYYGLEKEYPVWSVFVGILVFLGIMILISWMLRKKLEAAFNQVQNHILEAQERITRKIKAIGMRATPKFQEEMEREQAKSIREAMEMLVILEPFEKWNLLIKQQVNSLKGQFHYQLKEYAKAGECLQHGLLMDPMLVAMQMAVYYRQDKLEQVEKYFLKGTGRFKDSKAVLLYGLYSWILVQKNQIDKAIQILNEAKTRAEHPALKQNWDHLVNGHVKKFSNSQLGDQWYALMLETPKMQRIQQQASGRPW